MSLLPRTAKRLANLRRAQTALPCIDALFENAVDSCSGALLQGTLGRSSHCHARSHSAMPQPRLSDEEDYENITPSLSSANRLKWRESLPSVRHVADQLRSRPGSNSPCSTARKPAPAPVEEAPMSWEEVVAKARAAQAAGFLEPRESVLTDTFGRRHTYLRISLTERCNLRCLYCMPEEGVDLSGKDELLSVDEIMRLTRLFAGAGINKVRLTGGEPTLRRDLVDIVRGVASIEGVDAVGLTSNGVTLGKSLPELQTAGLSLLNISVDTLRPDRFEAMTRRKGHQRVMDSIWRAVDLGFDPVKVNVVVMKGVNDDEIADFVDLTKDAPINVRFIEYMPFDGNVWSSTKMMPFKDMAEAAGSRYGGARALQRLVDPSGEVAKNFKLPGHVGTVSFVSSMTSAFCGDCNRVRLMADGNLKVCLFGASEVSLRDAMRGGVSDDDLRAVVSAAVNRKKAAHAGMFELAKTKNRAMVKIGG